MRHEAQSTTNLGSSAIWTTNSLAPVVVNGQYMVTNPVSGSDHLLVTNVEAGTISVFDDGGSFLGNLQDPSGQDIVLIINIFGPKVSTTSHCQVDAHPRFEK